MKSGVALEEGRRLLKVVGGVVRFVSFRPIPSCPITNTSSEGKTSLG